MHKITPSGRERTFGEHELIVSKTDPRGLITYANSVFCRVSGYQEYELLGKPHNLVRHPDMPRGVFRLLWHRLQLGHEVFAMVVNLASNGDHYWVLAHVTPSFSPQGTLLGYHSNRRLPQPALVKEFSGLYQKLLEAERPISNPKQAAEVSMQLLLKLAGQDYDNFFFSRLNKQLQREAV
ncbi:PAS domain-containing protein [bacterium]|nr:PAS domain-containing protein [bacterium]